MGQNGANGSYQLTRIVQSGSLCADVVTALSLAMYTPIRVETCRDHRSRSTIFGEHAEIPRNAHLRTVNPSANAYAGSIPAPATTAQTWYLATLALAKATAKGLVPASSQHSAQSHVLTAFAATTPPQSVITSSV